MGLRVPEFLRVGTISSKIKGWGVFFLIMQFVLIIFVLSYIRWQDSSAGCISCHSNEAKMRSLGYPYFYITPKQVETESRHTTAQCRDCHLGNGRIQDVNKAHKGILKMIIVGENGEILPRKNFFPKAFKPEGENERDIMLPKIKAGEQPSVFADVRNILFHDRNMETLGYEPSISKKTCGQRNCHTEQVKQFSRTVMGTNLRQRTMKTWLVPYGPHNCGPSFADIPAIDRVSPVRKQTPFRDKSLTGLEWGFLYNGASKSRFSFENYDEIVKNLNIAFTKEQAVIKQKFCNVCHAGCLDCHYTPFKGEGVHSFSKTPPAQSCAGGGRGSTMCHTGSGESRRGSTYLGGDFSEPPGMEADVHALKESLTGKINCIDCHNTGPKGMGDIKRAAGCQDCHVEIEEAISQGRHKRLQCITCHVREVRGYQLVHWGQGQVGEKPNPFKKYFYYGVSKPPIIMKDQAGSWIPLKVMPHTVSNIKNPQPPSDKIFFRWPGGETADSYAVLGTFDGLPSGNLHLAWLDIEKISHTYGRARSCEDCHRNIDGAQEAVSTWEFIDEEGAEPFKGTFRIIADKKNLRILDIKATTSIKLYPVRKDISNGVYPDISAGLSDFAPWYYLKDIWQVAGDYSIPGKDYTQGTKAYGEAIKELNKLKDRMTEKEYRRLRVKTVHSH